MHKEKFQEEKPKRSEKFLFGNSLLEMINRLKQLPMPRFRYRVVENSLKKSLGFATRIDSLPPQLKPYALGSFESLQQLYATHVERSAIQTAMTRIGRLLSQRRGEEIREKSKEVVNEHLSGNKVNAYEPKLSQIVAETMVEWRERQLKGEKFDLRAQIDELYTKLVSATLFGGKQPENFSKISAMVSTYLTDMAGFTTAIILDEVMPSFLDFIKKPLQKTFVSNMEQYPEFLKQENELITELEAFLNTITPETYDQYGMFGSYLKAADAGVFSKDDVIRELIGMLFAALDTTSRATMFAVARLQENPELFLRLKKEVQEVFGKEYKEGTLELTKTDLNKIPALDAFVSAVIAADPPVNIEIRETMEPVDITESMAVSPNEVTQKQIRIPKGAMVFIHMQRALEGFAFDSEGKFTIDNFLYTDVSGAVKLVEENMNAVKYAWSMGGDKYPCMGYKLSLFELKTFLIHFLLGTEEIKGSGIRVNDQAAVQIPEWIDGDSPQPVFTSLY